MGQHALTRQLAALHQLVQNQRRQPSNMMISMIVVSISVMRPVNDSDIDTTTATSRPPPPCQGHDDNGYNGDYDHGSVACPPPATNAATAMDCDGDSCCDLAAHKGTTPLYDYCSHGTSTTTTAWTTHHQRRRASTIHYLLMDDYDAPLQPTEARR